MINLILFVLASAGLSGLLIEGSNLQWFRDQVKKFLPSIYGVFECYRCMGFWTGLFCSPLLIVLFADFSALFMFFVILCSAFIGSFVSVIFVLYLTYLEAKTIINIDEGENE